MTISLITPTFNRSAMLREALASVKAPGAVAVEHWVIDGNSNDDTLTWLPNEPGIHLLSEPDRGLYDALNKGLSRATGEIIGFLNSDDLLVAEALPSIVEAFADPAVQLVTGQAEFFRDLADRGKEVLRISSKESELELNIGNVLRGSPNINARFFRREFVSRVGEFDLTYSIAADREWLLRAVLLNPVQRVVPRLVYRYREHGDSLTVHATDRNVMRYRSEHVELAEKHLQGSRLSGDHRRFLQSFHRRETATLAARELRSGNVGSVREWAGRGMQQSAIWPLTFARRCAGMWFDKS